MTDIESLQQAIARLTDRQKYGVLCVAGANRAYGALVAYACNASMSALYFATPITTRKFTFLSETEQAAFLVDNRSERGGDVMAIEAATIVGPVRALESTAELELGRDLLLARHDYLRAFVNAPSSALFVIDIARVIHVSRFQEVREWTPAQPG
jgi:nitroimidazol reductase NimA-like FMN-containing flavoprotein (pyridoxamine 5'-phosphate oxidase superfamily)